MSVHHDAACRCCGRRGHVYRRRGRCWSCHWRALGWHLKPCRRCGRTGLLWKRRNLCKKCYYMPSSRRLYPPLDPEADPLLSGRDFEGEALPCPGLLEHAPGSPERVAELAERARRREELFAPQEAGIPAAVLAELLGAGGLG